MRWNKDENNIKNISLRNCEIVSGKRNQERENNNEED